jgi:hypothetical protein
MLTAFVLMTASYIPAATPDAHSDARAAVAVAIAIAQAQQASPTPVVPVTPVKTALTYNEGCSEAIRTGKKLVVYVGLKSEPNDDCIVCEVASLPNYPAKCIVHARAVNGVVGWEKILDANGAIIPVVSEPVQQPIFQSQFFQRQSSGSC